MGRPINKKYFGPPTAAGTELKCRYRATGESEANGWIVKQVAARRFKCTDGSNPMVCTLVDKAQGALAVGDMTIAVKEDGTTVKQITKISAHRVTLDSGTTIPWSWSASTSDGYVEMEEAGTNTSFASADDFETD